MKIQIGNLSNYILLYKEVLRDISVQDNSIVFTKISLLHRVQFQNENALRCQ